MQGYHPCRQGSFDSPGLQIRTYGKSTAEHRFSGTFLHKNGVFCNIQQYTDGVQNEIQIVIKYEYWRIFIQKA